MLMTACTIFFVLTDLKIPEPPGGIPKLKTLSTYCVVQIDDVAVAETPVQKDTLAPKWEKDVTTMLRRSQLIEIIVMHKVSSGPARTGRLSSGFSGCPSSRLPLPAEFGPRTNFCSITVFIYLFSRLLCR
jgi:hypothetical protein